MDITNCTNSDEIDEFLMAPRHRNPFLFVCGCFGHIIAYVPIEESWTTL